MSVSKQSPPLFPNGVLRAALFVGRISSISAQAVNFILADAWNPSGAQFLGGRYGRGEVGEFVLLEGQVNLLIGRIIEVRQPMAERLMATGPDSSESPLVGAVDTIQLLGSVATDTLRVTAGVDTYPRLGDRVYSAPHDFVAKLPTLMEPEGAEGGAVLIDLGVIDVAAECTVAVRPEKLFGRHCAILGSTGGGKSWTTARLIEECLRYDSKIILLDATGEYRGFSGAAVVHVHIGNPTHTAHGSTECALPPTCFVESDFLALFEPAGKVQGPKLRAAIRSLRLAKLETKVASNGIVVKINQKKAPIHAAEQRADIGPKLDDPRQEFDVARLPEQIFQECVHPDAFGPVKGTLDSSKWGADSGEFSHCIGLVTRINAILTSPAFASVFQSQELSLTDKIDQFISSEHRLLRICMSGVAYEYKAREIIANAIGRYLLNMARRGGFLTLPVVIVVDEAHNFLGRGIGGEDNYARLDAFEVIAKEGRKFGLNICLATQRPRDITDGVLSQMGTLVVHRLTNDRDREVVERACGEIDRSASAFIPNLKPGEAAIIGSDFPIPLTVQIIPPLATPKSDGPDYQSRWARKLPTA